MKKNLLLFLFFLFCSGVSFSQNISVNTTGAANSTGSMFEVLQPSTTNNTVGIFARHNGAATNAYAIWAEATGATNKYALVVPSGGGYVGIGNTTPGTFLDVSGNNISYIGQLRLSATDYDQVTFYNSGALTPNASNRLGYMYYDIAGTTLNIGNESGNKYVNINAFSGGNVGIGTTAPGAKLSFQDLNNGVNTPDGITWYNPAPTAYGIFRSSGAWSAPNYQQLNLAWQTGITIDGGSSYGLSGTILQPSAGNVAIGQAVKGAYNLEVNGTFGYGDGAAGSYRSRTESRADAGQMGTQSGFYQTSAPSPAADWYVGASSWQHLIDCRHSNNGNNYALQIAGSFFDQDLYYRKTNNSASQAWSKLLTSQSGWMLLGNGGTTAGTNFLGTTDGVDLVFKTTNAERMRILAGGNVGIGIATANAKLDVSTGSDGIAMGQIHGDNTNTIQTYIDGQWANRATYAGGCCNPLLLQPDVGVVGIGTAAPAEKLDVTGGNIKLTSYGAHLDLPEIGSTSLVEGIGAFVNGTMSDGIPWYGAYAREAGSWTYPYPDYVLNNHTGLRLAAHGNYGGISFYEQYNFSTGVWSTTGTELARFKHDNYGGSYFTTKLGVGTTAPGYQLDVAGTINTSLGGYANNGCIRFGSHTISSHPNSWIYIGDQNGSVYGGTGIAMGNCYVASTLYYPNGTQGAGKILTSDASGVATWSAPTSVLVYGNNMQSVKLAGMVSNNTQGVFSAIPGASITMTTIHNTFYVFASVTARLDQGSGVAAQFGQAIMDIEVVVDGTPVTYAGGVITDYDNTQGIVTTGTVAITGVPVTLAPGSHTIALYWQPTKLWATNPWTLMMNPAAAASDQCILTVFD